MATTFWGLLPWFQLFDDNINPLTSDFEIHPNLGLALRRTPPQLLTPPSGFIPESDRLSVEKSKWSLVCDMDSHEKAFDLLNQLSVLVRVEYTRQFFPLFIFETDSNGNLSENYSKWRVRTKSPFFEGHLYSKELAKLKQLFSIFHEYYLRSKTNHGRVYRALATLNESYFQRIDVLELLLIITAFECLFNDDRESISHIIAVRTACFLANPSRHNDIYERIKKAYDARSDFVHGRKIKGDYEPLCKFTRMYVSEILSKLIEDKKLWECLENKDKRQYRAFLRKLDLGEFTPQKNEEITP